MVRYLYYSIPRDCVVYGGGVDCTVCICRDLDHENDPASAVHVASTKFANGATWYHRSSVEKITGFLSGSVASVFETVALLIVWGKETGHRARMKLYDVSCQPTILSAPGASQSWVGPESI